MMGVKIIQFQCFRSFFFSFVSDNRKRMVVEAVSPPSVQEGNWLENTKPAATYTNKATTKQSKVRHHLYLCCWSVYS